MCLAWVFAIEPHPMDENIHPATGRVISHFKPWWLWQSGDKYKNDRSTFWSLLLAPNRSPFDVWIPLTPNRSLSTTRTKIPRTLRRISLSHCLDLDLPNWYWHHISTMGNPTGAKPPRGSGCTSKMAVLFLKMNTLGCTHHCGMVGRHPLGRHRKPPPPQNHCL